MARLARAMMPWFTDYGTQLEKQENRMVSPGIPGIDSARAGTGIAPPPTLSVRLPWLALAETRGRWAGSPAL